MKLPALILCLVALPVWAGVLPLRLTPGELVADERVVEGVVVPGYLLDYTRQPVTGNR